MVTCFTYSTISKAVCARQRLHTISCGYAMCLLHFPVFSHLRSPCHNFCHSFATCVAIAFARSATLPFRCHLSPFVATSVAKGFRSQLKFCHWICSPCFYPRQVFARIFCQPCCHYLFAPFVFFHPCCPAGCHRHCHCQRFCPRGCHGCCHQIWAPNRALLLNFG